MLGAVIFDFDLTLADSTGPVIECASYALARLGMGPASADDVRRTIGLTLPQSFHALTGSDDPGLAAEYVRHFVSRADVVMVSGTHVYPSVPPMLASLHGRGVRLAIVSSKLRRRIAAILQSAGLSSTIDVILGAEDVTLPKPHPQGLLRALERLQVEASRSLYVGDHPVDAEAAARAGIPFVAVRTGSSSPETWGTPAPLRIIDDAGQLRGVVDGES